MNVPAALGHMLDLNGFCRQCGSRYDLIYLRRKVCSPRRKEMEPNDNAYTADRPASDAEGFAPTDAPKHPFNYQRPDEKQIAAIEKVRDSCSQVFASLQANVPASAERTLAIRKLEEVSMWANKAIVFAGERYLP